MEDVDEIDLGACPLRVGRVVSRRKVIALATTALVLTAAGRAQGAGNGYFGYTGELTATYDTNIGRLFAVEVQDVVTVVSVEGRLGYRGEKNRLELSYRPLYESFVDQPELNSFDQFGRFGWSRAGSRSRSTAGASYGHSQDPRLALPPGVAPPPLTPPGVAPGPSPFLLRRTTIESAQGELGTEADIGPHSTIGMRAAALELSFEDPTLFDSTTLDGGLQYAFRPGERARWILGYRYDRFATTRTPPSPLVETDTVLTLDGGEVGGDYRFSPTLALQLRVGAVQAREEELEAIEGSDRIVGSVLLTRDRGPAEFASNQVPMAFQQGWSVGYVRDYAGGNGLFTVARSDEFFFSFVHSFGTESILSLRGHHGLSVQMIDPAPADPTTPREGASITSDTAMARYSHRFAKYWAMHTTAELTEQTGEDVPQVQGTFRDVRFSLGITFSDEHGF